MRRPVGIDRLLPQAEPGKDVRRHVQRVRDRRCNLCVAHCGRQPEFGELLRVVAMDQVVHDSRVVRLGLPHVFQNLGRLFFVSEGLVGRREGAAQILDRAEDEAGAA